MDDTIVHAVFRGKDAEVSLPLRSAFHLCLITTNSWTEPGCYLARTYSTKAIFQTPSINQSTTNS
jgi:hypothetical protein